MRNILLFLLGITFSISSAQSEFTPEDAKKVVDIFFEGFHEGDTLKMRGVMAGKLQLQTAFNDQQGNARISTSSIDQLLQAIAQRPADQKWDERLLDYKVQIDGNLAHVWTPYQFWLNGTFSHCGANAFTLGKTDEGWKILHLIDSRRREGCDL
jgi:hypothetical protein